MCDIIDLQAWKNTKESVKNLNQRIERNKQALDDATDEVSRELCNRIEKIKASITRINNLMNDLGGSK